MPFYKKINKNIGITASHILKTKNTNIKKQRVLFYKKYKISKKMKKIQILPLPYEEEMYKPCQLI